jgi:hypothetical protein
MLLCIVCHWRTRVILLGTVAGLGRRVDNYLLSYRWKIRTVLRIERCHLFYNVNLSWNCRRIAIDHYNGATALIWENIHLVWRLAWYHNVLGSSWVRNYPLNIGLRIHILFNVLRRRRRRLTDVSGRIQWWRRRISSFRHEIGPSRHHVLLRCTNTSIIRPLPAKLALILRHHRRTIYRSSFLNDHLICSEICFRVGHLDGRGTSNLASWSLAVATSLPVLEVLEQDFILLESVQLSSCIRSVSWI